MLRTILPLATLILTVVFELSAVVAANNFVLLARLIILRAWLSVLGARLIVLWPGLIALLALLIVALTTVGAMLTLSPAILPTTLLRRLRIIPRLCQQLRTDTHTQQTNTCQTPDARLHAFPHCGSGPIHKTGKA
jgi:hypothetical protein